MRIGDCDISSYGLGFAVLGSVGCVLTTRYFKCGGITTGTLAVAPWVVLGVRTAAEYSERRRSLEIVGRKCALLLPGGVYATEGTRDLLIGKKQVSGAEMAADVLRMAEKFRVGSSLLVQGSDGRLVITKDHRQFYSICSSLLDELKNDMMDTTSVIRKITLLRLAVGEAGQKPESPWRRWGEWCHGAQWMKAELISRRGEILFADDLSKPILAVEDI